MFRLDSIEGAFVEVLTWAVRPQALPRLLALFVHSLTSL
jgi:hypothetical protein